MVKSSDVEMEENKENEGKAEPKVTSQNTTTSTPDSEQGIHQQSSEKLTQSNDDEEADHGIIKSNLLVFIGF